MGVVSAEYMAKTGGWIEGKAKIILLKRERGKNSHLCGISCVPKGKVFIEYKFQNN